MQYVKLTELVSATKKTLFFLLLAKHAYDLLSSVFFLLCKGLEECMEYCKELRNKTFSFDYAL